VETEFSTFNFLFVEITPKRDINDISSITAGRLIINLIGMAV